MLDRHRRRRAEAQARVAQEKPRLTLMDPLFNLREITKQLLLLEDHLAHENRRCPDCIRKHLLCIEALADEAVALDPTGIYVSTGGTTAEVAREWGEQLLDGVDPAEVGRRIRFYRKHLTPLVFDPRKREACRRVATAFLHRHIHTH